MFIFVLITSIPTVFFSFSMLNLYALLSIHRINMKNMFKTIECHTQTHESNDPQKNPFAASATTACWCCRHHCRQHSARAALECVHICGEPLFWFSVAHYQHSHAHTCMYATNMWIKSSAEKKRERLMCSLSFDFAVYTTLHYIHTHMCLYGVASNVKLPLALSLFFLCLPLFSFTLSSTSSSIYLSVLLHTHKHIRSL